MRLNVGVGLIIEIISPQWAPCCICPYSTLKEAHFVEKNCQLFNLIQNNLVNIYISTHTGYDNATFGSLRINDLVQASYTAICNNDSILYTLSCHLIARWGPVCVCHRWTWYWWYRMMINIVLHHPFLLTDITVYSNLVSESKVPVLYISLFSQNYNTNH